MEPVFVLGSINIWAQNGRRGLLITSVVLEEGEQGRAWTRLHRHPNSWDRGVSGGLSKAGLCLAH